MPLRSTVLLYLGVAAISAGIIQLAEISCGTGIQPTRYFLPGELGTQAHKPLMEDGLARILEYHGTKRDETRTLSLKVKTAGSGLPTFRTFGNQSKSFLTRTISGLQGVEGEAWGRKNGLTNSLAFSHNLAVVFPPELYKTHPELFPLVEGKRLDPPKGSYFWNPDIAREDAALHAARVAREYFATHPEEISFALGVNDALIWGESPEIIALLLRGEQEGATTDDRQRSTNDEHAKERESRGDGVSRSLAVPPSISPLKWFRGRPDYSNVVFTFMNRAADELSRTHPKKYLGALAYYWCENVPSFGLNPQVVPFLTADRSQGYDESFRNEEFELQTKWGSISGAKSREVVAGVLRQANEGVTLTTGSATGLEITGSLAIAHDSGAQISHFGPPRRLGMYDYLCGAGFLIPRIYTKLLAENLRHARRAGFTDYYAAANPNWGLDGPMPWLTAQILRDPEQPLDALLEEYYGQYFREAGKPMQQFFEKCEKLWMAQPGPSYWLKHYRNESQAIVFPPHERKSLRSLLDEAELLSRSRKVQQRVRLVSETFRITESFCKFNEERDRLNKIVLGSGNIPKATYEQHGTAQGSQVALSSSVGPPRSEISSHPSLVPPPSTNSMLKALTDYLNTRRDFIRNVVALRYENPLALHPVNYDDFLRNNPGFAAAVRLLDGAPGDVRVLNWLSQRPESWIQAAVQYHLAKSSGRLRNVLSAGGLEGDRLPGRRIAGLVYGIDLPPPWQSRLEPTQAHEGVVLATAARTGAAGLRISGAINSSVYQWVPITGRSMIVASVFARAHISPSDAITLTLGWLDKDHRPIGTVVVARIPDGNWPDWIQLQQGSTAPEKAVWAGLGIRLQNQLPGDWAEFDDFSLFEVQSP